jgi:hypothetical protein
MIVLIYLAAIVAANVTVAAFGPGMVIVNAFVLIGLDLTARDKLHDAWRGRWLWPRMALLILTGGVLSWVLNAGAIALASTVAFALSASADAVTYSVLGSRARMLRINGSNVVGAAVDSLVFPTLAFGGFLPVIVIGQFAAKVAGGFVWSVILSLPVRRPAA